MLAVGDSTRPSPWAATWYALRLGCLSFGGPAGQIALVSRELVEERRWLPAADFARALNLAMLLPGPEALQTVIYVGWRLYGAPGGIVAGLAFLGPGAVLLVGLSWLYMRWGALAPVAAGLTGLKAVVVALVSVALVSLARRMLRARSDYGIAIGAGLWVAVLHFSSAVALALGALVTLAMRQPHEPTASVARPTRDYGHVCRVIGAGLVLWCLPWGIVHIMAPGSVAEQVYLTLTRVALGGFGGAYAIVSWVGQLFVQDHHWIGVADLTAGIGLSETTPGPLLLVLQFYGFAAGWLAATPSLAWISAIICAFLASWATFLPSFVLVLALAPEVESLVARPAIARALQGVGAAVVGVIATFAVGVGRAVLMPQGMLDWRPTVIAAGAGLLLSRRGVGLPATMALGIVAGWLTG